MANEKNCDTNDSYRRYVSAARIAKQVLSCFNEADAHRIGTIWTAKAGINTKNAGLYYFYGAFGWPTPTSPAFACARIDHNKITVLDFEFRGEDHKVLTFIPGDWQRHLRAMLREVTQS